jgi:hypothetical protein
MMLTNVGFSSRLEKLGINMEDPTRVLGIEMPNQNRPPKWLFNIPGLVLLAVVLLNQLRQRKKTATSGKPILEAVTA